MDFTEAHQLVLEWAQNADSYDKIGFLKAYTAGMGAAELHHAKEVLNTHRKNNRRSDRKRSWVGPTPDEKRKCFRRMEEPACIDEVPPASSLRRSLWPRCDDAWWRKHLKSDVIGFDSEYVHLLNLSGVSRIRAGTVAVVNSRLETLIDKKVYHKPGSFLDNKAVVKVSGIHRYDLINGTPMATVTFEIKSLFENKLVITVGATVDFTCVDLCEADFDTFDLQTFYRRSGPNGELYGMSLRDIYFMLFQRDFQGTKTHSAVNDAAATVEIFLKDYVIRNKSTPGKHDPYFFQRFDDAINLRLMDKQGLLYFNNDKKFKNSKIDKSKPYPESLLKQ